MTSDFAAIRLSLVSKLLLVKKETTKSVDELRDICESGALELEPPPWRDFPHWAR
jgi:hypothetical protein